MKKLFFLFVLFISPYFAFAQKKYEAWIVKIQEHATYKNNQLFFDKKNINTDSVTTEPCGCMAGGDFTVVWISFHFNQSETRVNRSDGGYIALALFFRSDLGQTKPAGWYRLKSKYLNQDREVFTDELNRFLEKWYKDMKKN